MLIRFLREFAGKHLRARAPSPADLDRIRNALQAGELAKARALCDKALEARPDDADLLHFAGAIAHQQGDEPRAIAHLTRAAAARDDPEPAYALGHMHRRAGRIEEAIACFARAVDLDEDRYEFRYALAEALSRGGRLADSEPHLRAALAARPDSLEAHALLTRVLYDQGRNEELAQSVRAIQRVSPFDGGDLFVALLVPVVYQSVQEIEDVRHELAQRLDRLLEGPPLAVGDPVREIGITPFHLAYHGLNDCELQTRIARVCRKAYRPAHGSPLPPRRRDGRIRIGFVSEHFKFHSVARVNHALISGLPREAFEVSVFSLARHDDVMARRIRAESDRYFAFDGEPLAVIERAIAEQQMDVLFFTDVGMDPLTYFLAYSRLAPLQCLAWGHPDTTGIDTLDCAISADALELPDAGTHYTERLVRLPAWVMPGYERPALPQPPRTRAAFGFDERAHVYLCPQVPQKLHPDFDEAIGGILRDDPRGIVVLVEGRHPRLTDLLQQRFRRTLPEVAERVRVVPNLPWRDYLNLLAVADVMLDPFHFGGANTTYEGLGLGVPVVTLPPRYLRGRHTLGCYLKMEMTDCVAATPEEYVRIAVRLGTEPDYRREVVTRINERSDALYGNPEMARALGEYLVEACASSS